MINKEWWHPEEIKTEETKARAEKDTEPKAENKPSKISPQFLLELLRQIFEPEEKPAPKDWYK